MFHDELYVVNYYKFDIHQLTTIILIILFLFLLLMITSLKKRGKEMKMMGERRGIRRKELKISQKYSFILSVFGWDHDDDDPKSREELISHVYLSGQKQWPCCVIPSSSLPKGKKREAFIVRAQHFHLEKETVTWISITMEISLREEGKTIDRIVEGDWKERKRDDMNQNVS